MATSTPFKSWALVELLGHRSLPGFAEEVELAGKRMILVRVPELRRDDTGKVLGLDLEQARLEQFVPPDSLYALTPTTEETIAKLLVREAHYLPALPPPGTPPAPAEPEDVDETEVGSEPASTAAGDEGPVGPDLPHLADSLSQEGSRPF